MTNLQSFQLKNKGTFLGAQRFNNSLLLDEILRESPHSFLQFCFAGRRV